MLLQSVSRIARDFTKEAKLNHLFPIIEVGSAGFFVFSHQRCGNTLAGVNLPDAGGGLFFQAPALSFIDVAFYAVF